MSFPSSLPPSPRPAVPSHFWFPGHICSVDIENLHHLCLTCFNTFFSVTIITSGAFWLEWGLGHGGRAGEGGIWLTKLYETQHGVEHTRSSALPEHSGMGLEQKEAGVLVLLPLSHLWAKGDGLDSCLKAFISTAGLLFQVKSSST